MLSKDVLNCLAQNFLKFPMYIHAVSLDIAISPIRTTKSLSILLIKSWSVRKLNARMDNWGTSTTDATAQSPAITT
jgi:hypothetical protein